MEIKPIAIFRTQKKNPYEAARQAAVDLSTDVGEIHFLHADFRAALDGIEKFSHLWLIYQFHHNDHWKAKVRPPRGSDHKIGVLATRSPYRPNALGLSCVQLMERDSLILRVRQFDLLDETPIFDVKPYLAYADSFPEASLGWLQGIDSQKFTVEFSALAQTQIDFLRPKGLLELENFIRQQLQFEPFQAKKKRVRKLSQFEGELAYRTWRAHFSLSAGQVVVERIFSGYSPIDLESSEDKYGDHELHRQFIAHFS